MKKNHPLSVKINAVLHANLPGVLAEDIANKLGIHTFSLYRWKKELRDAGLIGDMTDKTNIKKTLEQAEELKRLRKENEDLKLENDVLKKLKEYGEARKKKPSK